MAHWLLHAGYQRHGEVELPVCGCPLNVVLPCTLWLTGGLLWLRVHLTVQDLHGAGSSRDGVHVDSVDLHVAAPVASHYYAHALASVVVFL